MVAAADLPLDGWSSILGQKSKSGKPNAMPALRLIADMFQLLTKKYIPR